MSHLPNKQASTSGVAVKVGCGEGLGEAVALAKGVDVSECIVGRALGRVQAERKAITNGIR